MRRPPAVLLVAALVLPLLASPAAAAPDPAFDAPGTVVVPPRDVLAPLLPTERSTVTEHGIAFEAATEELAPRRFYRLPGNPLVRELERTGTARVVVGRDVVVVAPEPPRQQDVRDVRLVDLATGGERTLPVLGSVLAVTPQGLLGNAFVASGSEVRLTPLDGSPARRVTSGFAAVADDRGAVLLVAEGARTDVVAVDLDGARRTLASRTFPGESPPERLALSAGQVAFRTGSGASARVVTVARDGSGPERGRSAPEAAVVAVRDDSVAWITNEDPQSRLSTAPLDPAAPATTVDLGVRMRVFAGQLGSGFGGFVLPRGEGTPRPGFALVRPGGTALEPLVDAPRQPAVLDDLALDGDRLVISDEVTEGGLAVRRVRLTGGEAAYGQEELRPAGPGVVAQRLAGDRTVEVEATRAGTSVVVREAGRELLRTSGGPDLQEVALSGRRLLLGRGDDAGTTGSTRLVDVPTGAVLDLPRGAALWGPYVAYVDDQRRVVRRDLDRPGSPLVVLRTLTGPLLRLQVDGDDVLVDGGGDLDGVTLHRVEGGEVRSAVVPRSGVAPVVLGGGALLRRSTPLLEQSDPAELLAGRPRWVPVGQPLDDVLPTSDDELVAWPSNDGRVRLRRLPVDVARLPRVLSVVAPTATGDGSFPFEAEVSEPLESWRLQVRGPSGAVVRTYEGTTSTGSVRARWDGRDGTGATVADGVHTWQLTGRDADGDGSLRTADGTALQSGTVAVRRAAPVVALSAPGVSTVASATRSFPVRWTAPAGLRVDLRYAEVVDGVARTSRPWLTGTTARSAVFGAGGVPTGLVAGRTYRITAVARDELGRTSPVRAVTTAVPLDDRARGLRYAGAWTSVAASGRYSGTLRTSSARGASVTVSGGARTLHVVADRCPACGRFDVVLDGKVVARVDTRSTTTRARQTVWSRAVPAPGRHVLQLRVVSGRVALDGIALGQ